MHEQWGEQIGEVANAFGLYAFLCLLLHLSRLLVQRVHILSLLNCGDPLLRGIYHLVFLVERVDLVQEGCGLLVDSSVC